jgi:hypothetical protein
MRVDVAGIELDQLSRGRLLAILRVRSRRRARRRILPLRLP